MTTCVRKLGVPAMALFGLAASASAELIYGTTQNQFLVTFDSAAPGTILTGVPLSGLQNNERIVGIDVRPNGQMLYGAGSFSNLYVINPATGAATPFNGGAIGTTLNGSNFGVDFNPAADRLRITSNADQNLRLNPTVNPLVTLTDGALAFDPNDVNAGVNPNVVHSAYTNNFAGTPTTMLYDVDSGLDALLLQTPPNNGTLRTIGSIGTDVTEVGGFDISGATGVAYMAIQDVALARSTFWTVNLSTGAASPLGEVGGGEILTGISVVPEPASALIALAAAAFALRRR